MAADIATLSQLLQASLDPRQNKQGKWQQQQHSAFVYTTARPRQRSVAKALCTRNARPSQRPRCTADTCARDCCAWPRFDSLTAPLHGPLLLLTTR